MGPVPVLEVNRKSAVEQPNNQETKQSQIRLSRIVPVPRDLVAVA
jgi:hypothetical protein